MGRPGANLKPIAEKKEMGGAEKERKRKFQQAEDNKMSVTMSKFVKRAPINPPSSSDGII